jgi:DNA-directed RNA polymerase II subunit RPB2
MRKVRVTKKKNTNTQSKSNTMTSSKIKCNQKSSSKPPSKSDIMDEYNEVNWKVIESYFKNDHLGKLVRHQLESYNHFIDEDLINTINMFNPVTIRSENDKDEKTGLYKLEITITFSNFQMYRPEIHENNGATKIMFPQEARLRNFTYASTMTLDLNMEIKVRYGENLQQVETHFKKLPKIHIGKMPIMLKSKICVLTQYKHLHTDLVGECRFDPGGYFIISGSEKTILAQERACENKVMCFNIKKNNNKWSWLAEIKSIPKDKCISPKQINMMIAAKSNGTGHSIYIQIPRIKQPIPLFILFRALGVMSDKEICEYILLNINEGRKTNLIYSLKASIMEASKCITQEDAIKYIVNYAMFTPINMDKEEGYKMKYNFTTNVLENDLFPHCDSLKQRLYFLGYMTNQLIQTSLGWKKCSDRDSYKNKRLDLAGVLLNNLFRNYFNKLVKDMTKQIIREINNGSWKSTYNYTNIINNTNVYKIIKSTTIENGIKRALATGDFGIKNTNSNKSGVAQVLSRLTYISSLSHLRRVNTPIDKSGKLIPPRKLHNTQWGFICLAESPEGAGVGVVKNLGYMTHITIRSNIDTIYNVLKDKYVPIETKTPIELHGEVKLMVNGNWIGIIEREKVIDTYDYLKQCKYNGKINIFTSVVFDYKNKEIQICNDAGRLTRPVYKVKKGKTLLEKNSKLVDDINSKKVDWNDMLINSDYGESVIEYVDPAEQNASYIATSQIKLETSKTHTHCEIHSSSIFGLLASCIPFPEHNQSPRNTYQCAQGKQAMGMYVSNFRTRMDKTAYVQTYTTRPLVDTRIMNIMNLHKIPSGCMVIVAIGVYGGYNQEDSIIFNKSSLDRGLFSATLYHTEKDEDKKIQGDEEIRCKADKTKTKGMKFANYNKLNNQGVVPENTLLENRDIIIGKVVPIKENRNDHTKLIKYRDQSKVFRTKENTYVDKNYINRNGDGYTFAKIRTRTYRVPTIGDKFSSRHGQKGTIGLILPHESMPTSANGLTPDIIINPHCIPSRMTIGQLKETVMGKVLLQLGLFGDGTSFNEHHVVDICKELQKLGYERHGNEILYNGMSGEQLETSIFIGPVFYQRLKHMVNDKNHSRSIGPMVVLTRQPAEGRSRDGGLRFGEMERDCMISHGASAFTRDRIYGASDKFEVHTCNKCGLIAVYNKEKNIHYCNTCENKVDFKRVLLPYSCKLLFQELISMNIAPRLITE